MSYDGQMNHEIVIEVDPKIKRRLHAELNDLYVTMRGRFCAGLGGIFRPTISGARKHECC